MLYFEFKGNRFFAGKFQEIGINLDLAVLWKELFVGTLIGLFVFKLIGDFDLGVMAT
jgi:hypothetical protein